MLSFLPEVQEPPLRLQRRAHAAVLYCGTDAQAAALFRYILEQAGFVVAIGDSKARCAALYAEERPDVILFDHAVEDLTNLQLEAYGLPSSRDAQLVVLVSEARWHHLREDEMWRHGVEILPRNIPPARLVSILRSIVHARRVSVDEVLTFEDLTLDLVSFRAFRSGRELRLGPLEFRLLRHFISDPSRVFSRSQLAQAAWRHDVYIGSRTVDVHVARLRRALNGQAKRKLIRTVRGVGYALS
jgi:two-component system, OmpR family, phosphate regulon response regulator PhoB